MPAPVVLSLISHTNAGKTTLLRTLLREDVGEVGDRAHVTVEAKAYPLVETSDGEVLELWDTPGFGVNLAKLAGRIKLESNPIGWLLHQVWDRHRDPSLFHSQTALRNVQERADVVVYVIDLSQKPEQAGFVDAEMEILSLVGKPVIVALNQTGTPDPDAARAREEKIRILLARFPAAQRVISLDAFTRCWIQEFRLFDLVTEVIDSGRQALARKVVAEWKARQLGVLAGSADRLSRHFAESVTDSESFSHPSLVDRLRQLVNKKARDAEFDRLQAAMYERLRGRTGQVVNDLIALHGIDGTSARKFAEAAREQFTASGGRLDEVLASLGGGALSGLVGGVVLDIASHGISFGSGAAIGAVLGGATSYALARGYNLTQGDSQTVRWTESHFRDEVRFALLLYLAVAHFGRGRGRWHDAAENPSQWGEIANRVTESHREDLAAFWKAGKSGDADKLQKKHRDLVETLLREALLALYPNAAGIFK